MGAGFAEVPEALRDDTPRVDVAGWFAPPQEEPRRQSPFVPPGAERRAEDFACFDGYAEDERQSHAATGVDPVVALEDHLMLDTARKAGAKLDGCMERERRLARINCEAGLFPDAHKHANAELDECVSMWVDGIDDETLGNGYNMGSSHSVGGGFEVGPEFLKANGGYQYTTSSEHSATLERTRRGVPGTGERCIRERDEALAQNRGMVTP